MEVPPPLDRLLKGIQLPPSSLQPLQPLSSTQQTIASNQTLKTPPKLPVGSTWSDLSTSLNIDVDNLSLAGSKKLVNQPTMNQLASTPTSPVNQPRPVNNFANQGYISPQNNIFGGNQVQNNLFQPFK